MANDSSERFVLLNQLADEFAARYRRGERPSLQEYIDRHPELADGIREFFPAMAEMEQVKEDRQDVSEPTVAGPLPPLERLGDFRIIRQIGHGGMGVVYEAEQVSLGRHVALKVLPQKRLVDARTKQRFEREAKAAAKLHHTNIVPVFGVGEHEGMPYYVMQFIPGLGLDEILEELKQLQPGAKGSGSSPRLTRGELRVSRRDVTVADVARSLWTGQFVPAADVAVGQDADPAGPSQDRHPASQARAQAAAADATIDHDPARLSPSEGEIGEGADVPGSPKETPVGGRLSDTFSLSSSSVVLPGAEAARASGKKQPSYWQSVARIGVQVAEALEYAHHQGILHRDIKPSNLLLDTRGTVWVTDFGLAKADDQQNLTQPGDVLGTLRYMPPEAFEGRTDARGDIYALGLTLYETLSLRPAFEERDRNRLIKQVTTAEPARLERLNRAVPRDLVTIVHKAIERDSAHRYPTAGALAADLQRFLADEPIQARRQTQLERYVRWARRNPGIAVLGGVLTAVLMLATVASLLAAGHFNRLRLNEAQAAQSERDAREREAKEREQAEQARKAADESRAQAVKALEKAEENYAKARGAVNAYLTAISDDPRLREPELSPLRAQLLQSALAFYQEFLKERGDDPGLRSELAAVHYKVGQIYSDLGQSQPANQSYAQSLRLYEALAADAPDDPAIQDGLAKALFRQDQNDRAIAIWEKLIRPNDPGYLYDLGWAYNTAAIAYGFGTSAAANKQAKKDPAKELEFLRKALATREQLVKLRPDDPEARQGLAASLNNIAVALGTTPGWAYLLETGREAEKLSLYRRAVEQMEVAYRLRPKDPRTVQGVVVLVRNVAATAKVLGRADEAVVAYRRVVEVLEHRARDNPDLPGTPTNAGPQTTAAEMVTAYLTLVAYLRELGRLDEAAQVARQGRDRVAELTTGAGSFFHALARFHLEARAVAEARAKGAVDARSDVEAASSAAVAALRDNVLTGWRDSNWLRKDLLPAPLRKRADYQELIVRVEALTRAEQVARNAQSPPAAKVTARQKCLAALEALAGPLPSARFIRRILAQARQDLALALLAAGRVEDARLAFAEALAVRQRLVEEAPSSEQLRADLAQGQSAAGDLLVAAGKLADAARIWETALATLEDGLKKNPNSIPFQTALSERLLHVADEYGKVGSWDLTTKHYRRAFEVQDPTAYNQWSRLGVLLVAANDLKGLQALAARASVLLAFEKNEWSIFHLSRIFLLSPELASRHTKALRQIIERVKTENRDWGVWSQGLAYVRLGQAEKGVPLLEKVKDPSQRLPVLALALHQMGRTNAARDALRQADELADQLLLGSLLADTLVTPGKYWDEWVLFQSLRREAHLAIHGKPIPESPYDRFFHGRLLSALDEPEKAEAEFAAAVAMRPNDGNVRLTRDRILARLGRKDRVTAAPAPAASPAQAEDLRRERKARADRLSNEFALALIRVNVGPKAHAEAELRSVLARRVKLAAEEPNNPDYRSDLFASRIQLGRFLAGSGRMGEADKELTEAVANGQKIVAERPTDRRARLDLAAAYRASGYVAWTANLPANAVRALRSGVALLDAVRKEDPNNAGLKQQLADAEFQLGDCYARLGLLPEAAAVMHVDDWETMDDLWLQVRAGQLRLLAGDPSSLRKVAERAFARHGTDTSTPVSYHDKAWTLTAVALAHALAPGPTDDSARLLEWARKAAASAAANTMPQGVAGAWEYRTGWYADAIRRLDTPALREKVWANAILAMAYHKLNRPDRAQEWLKRSANHLADHVRTQIVSGRDMRDGGWHYLVDDLCFYQQAHELVTGKRPPSDPFQRLYRADGYHRLGEKENAEAEFKAVVEARPDDPAVWLARGEAYVTLGQPARAMADFARARSLAQEALADKVAPADPNATAANWLVLALAQQRLGENDQARQAYRQAAAAMKPVGDNALLLELLREALREFRPDALEVEGVLAAAIGAPPAALNEAVRSKPRDAKAYLDRGDWYGRQGLWRRAADDYAAGYRLQPTAITGMRFGILLAWIGDADRYRDHCKELLNHFAGTTNNYEADGALKTCCLLGPPPVDNPALLARLADVVVSGDDSHQIYTWFYLAKGMYEYRAGRFDAAVTTCRANRTRIKALGGSAALVAEVTAVEAMALYRSGDADAARRLLAEAPTLIYDQTSEWDHDRLAARLLYREAETLLGGNKAEPKK